MENQRIISPVNFLQKIFGSQSRSVPEPAFDSKFVVTRYMQIWPDLNDAHGAFKPASALPFPKHALISALKKDYSEWNSEIDWTVFSGYAQMFIDLAAFVPDESFEAIQTMGKVLVDRKDSGQPAILGLMLITGFFHFEYLSTEPPDRSGIIERAYRQCSERAGAPGLDIKTLNLAFAAIRSRESDAVEHGHDWRTFTESIGRDTFVSNR